MKRCWTPKSQILVTDAGVVITVEMEGIRSQVATTYEDGQLCLRGLHEVFGRFETRFEVPPGHDLGAMRMITAHGVLRIEIPPAKKPSESFPFLSFPRSMLIYCNQCGKHFDIVLASKDPATYHCPACSAAQVFDLGNLMDKAIEQGQKMLRKKRGRR